MIRRGPHAEDADELAIDRRAADGGRRAGDVQPREPGRCGDPSQGFQALATILGIAGRSGEHSLERGIGRSRDASFRIALPAYRPQHDHRLFAGRIAPRGQPFGKIARRDKPIRQLEARRQAAFGEEGLGRVQRRLRIAVRGFQRPASVDPHRATGRGVQPPTAQPDPLAGGPGVVGQGFQDRGVDHFSASSFSTMPRASGPDQSAGPAMRARSRPWRS